MRFHIMGADKDTGNDIEIDITARDRAEAEVLATKRGVMVAAVEPIKDADPGAIDLADDPKAKTGTRLAMTAPTEGGGGNSAAVDPSVARAMNSGSMSGKSMPGASSMGGSQSGQSSISGAIGGSTSQPGAHMEYHVIMNQSLYLLEVAVNKHLKDGWEPQGGITVGISNNALQYFQAMIRHKD